MTLCLTLHDEGFGLRSEWDAAISVRVVPVVCRDRCGSGLRLVLGFFIIGRLACLQYMDITRVFCFQLFSRACIGFGWCCSVAAAAAAAAATPAALPRSPPKGTDGVRACHQIQSGWS